MLTDDEGIMNMACCTIVTKSHLSYARALARSILKHNPGAKFFVLLADRIDGYFDPKKEPFELIKMEELSEQDDIQQMCFYYTPLELCMCLRAWLHEYFFQKTEFTKWAYFDADILVYHSLKRVSEQLDNTSILLSPHLLSINPPPSINVKAIRKLESYLLRNGGIYNGGFMAMRRTEESSKFIKWFKDHLRLYGFNNRPMQLGDQFWLSYVPLYFREVSVQRDPGVNLAYWNLYERIIEQDGSGNIVVNGEPLLFFHFAGFDMNAPNKLSKYGIPRGLDIVPDLIREIVKDYYHFIMENGYSDSKNYPYAFANFKSGQKITPLMRRCYFEEIYRNRLLKGSPFENYEYLHSRLRLVEIKNCLRTIGKYLITQIGKSLNPDYYFDKP